MDEKHFDIETYWAIASFGQKLRLLIENNLTDLGDTTEHAKRGWKALPPVYKYDLLHRIAKERGVSLTTRERAQILINSYKQGAEYKCTPPGLDDFERKITRAFNEHAKELLDEVQSIIHNLSDNIVEYTHGGTASVSVAKLFERVALDLAELREEP